LANRQLVDGARIAFLRGVRVALRDLGTQRVGVLPAPFDEDDKP
jgi:hypothetical protein